MLKGMVPKTCSGFFFDKSVELLSQPSSTFTALLKVDIFTSSTFSLFFLELGSLFFIPLDC